MSFDIFDRMLVAHSIKSYVLCSGDIPRLNRPSDSISDATASMKRGKIKIKIGGCTNLLYVFLFLFSDAARLTDEEMGAMYATPMKKEKKAKKSKIIIPRGDHFIFGWKCGCYSKILSFKYVFMRKKVTLCPVFASCQARIRRGSRKC